MSVLVPYGGRTLRVDPQEKCGVIRGMDKPGNLGPCDRPTVRFFKAPHGAVIPVCDKCLREIVMEGRKPLPGWKVSSRDEWTVAGVLES